MEKLHEEEGITRKSIENIDFLVTNHGAVRFLIHHAPEARSVAGDMTFFVFQDGYNHVATGFASGYGGEGPRGLQETIQKHLRRHDITLDHIASWPRGSDFMILNGRGKGEEVHNFMSDPKATRTEIW